MIIAMNFAFLISIQLKQEIIYMNNKKFTLVLMKIINSILTSDCAILTSRKYAHVQIIFLKWFHQALALTDPISFLSHSLSPIHSFIHLSNHSQAERLFCCGFFFRISSFIADQSDSSNSKKYRADANEIAFLSYPDTIQSNKHKSNQHSQMKMRT